MNWAWAGSLDQWWRAPAFPLWVTLASAGFFGVIVLITLLRAEKTVANGALTVMTLLAIGVAVAVTSRNHEPADRGASPGGGRSAPAASASMPALACLDDLAGEAVLSACEKALFGSAESAAAAVSFTASQIARLTALGTVQAAESRMTPELLALRRALERDRYGLVAQVLLARDRCTPVQCAAFSSLTDTHQIASNMDEHVYDVLVEHYASSWNAPPSAGGALAGLPPSVPTGKPTNADFPSAASTPPVSIMTPEPATGTAAPRANPPSAANAAAPPRPAPAQAQAQTQAQTQTQPPAAASAKKPPAPSAPRPLHPPAGAPTSLAPSPPAASND